MKNQSLSLALIRKKLNAYLLAVKPYALPVFLLFVVGMYGFVFMKVNSLSSAHPTDSEISSQVQAAPVLHVDPKVVQQLESLQDHSVSVQALFDQARSNPFTQ